MTDPKPTVLFVCVSNAGKSQMAEALMRAQVGNAAEIISGGTRPKGSVNAESAASVAHLGASMDAATSKAIDEDVLRRADRVIVLGSDAVVEPVSDMKASIERWVTVEPSGDGITGAERMDLIRDDIQARVEQLATELNL